MPGNFAGNFGLRGLAKWADAVADRRSKTGWARLFDSGPAFGHAMRRLYDCLTFDHSSPGAMRPLYADFLTESAGILGDPALARGRRPVRGGRRAVGGDRRHRGGRQPGRLPPAGRTAAGAAARRGHGRGVARPRRPRSRR